MMEYLRKYRLSPGSDIQSLIEIMVQLQEHRSRTVGATTGKISRTTALLSAGLLNSNISSALEAAGLDWEKFSTENGARDFELREVASEQMPDPNLHTRLRAALQTYSALFPNRPVDAAGLAFAVLKSIDPKESGLPARLRKSAKAASLEDFLSNATVALARAFPDLAQVQPPPEPTTGSEAQAKPEAANINLQSEAPQPETTTEQRKPRKKKSAKKTTKKKASKPEPAPPDPDEDTGDVPDLPPTPEDSYQPLPRVARDFWTIEDKLGLGDYADAVAAFLRHEETRPPLTIGIKAPWGAGKTSLMRMIQARLDPPVDPEASRWEFWKIRLTDKARQVLQATEESERGESYDSDSSQSVYSVLRRIDRAPEERPDFAGIGRATETPIGDKDAWRATVWFNPWMYQSGEEVWAGFVHEIVEQVTGRLEDVDRERFWFELNLRRLDRQAVRRKIYRVAFERVLPMMLLLGAALVAALFLTLGGASLVDDPPDWANPKTAGSWAAGLWAIASVTRLVAFLRGDASTAVDPLLKSPSFGGAADSLRQQFEGTLDDILPEFDYASKTGFLHLVQNDIRHVLDLVATKDRPLVIFVDDLDRCSPGVVAQTIEAINLFLAGEFPNVIFVLAVEPAVVAAHVEVAHEKLVERLKTAAVGSDWSTLGWRFLEKIVQLPLSLPRADRDQTRNYLASLFGTDQQDEDAKTKKRTRERIQATVKRTVAYTTQTLKTENVNLDSLPELLKTQRESANEPDFTPDEAKEVHHEVAAALFAQFYKDSDPVVQKIVTEEALKLPSRNAREMKRLLNLFRFYSFVAAKRRLLNLDTGTTQRETLEVVARLCVFLIRWPFLLSAVSQRAEEDGARTPDDDGRGPIRLEKLEDAANEDDDEAWDGTLDLVGLVTKIKQRDESVAVRTHESAAELREYLRGEPRIGELARGLL